VTGGDWLRKRRRLLARSPAGDVHPRVSAPPSSRLTAVPSSEKHAHNPRLSPASGDATGLLLRLWWVGTGEMAGLGESRGPDLRLGFEFWGFLCFNSVLSRSNPNPFLIHAMGKVDLRELGVLTQWS
jgi:hypothetical protein